MVIFEELGRVAVCNEAEWRVITTSQPRTEVSRILIRRANRQMLRHTVNIALAPVQPTQHLVTRCRPARPMPIAAVAKPVDGFCKAWPVILPPTSTKRQSSMQQVDGSQRLGWAAEVGAHCGMLYAIPLLTAVEVPRVRLRQLSTTKTRVGCVGDNHGADFDLIGGYEGFDNSQEQKRPWPEGRIWQRAWGLVAPGDMEPNTPTDWNAHHTPTPPPPTTPSSRRGGGGWLARHSTIEEMGRPYDSDLWAKEHCVVVVSSLKLKL